LNRKRLETERRKWVRLPLTIPVFVHSADENGREFLEFASALNVSAGGALVALRRSVRLSAKVLLEIPNAPMASLAPATTNPSSMAAEAIRLIHAEGYHLVAFKFSTPLLTGRSPKQRKETSSL